MSSSVSYIILHDRTIRIFPITYNWFIHSKLLQLLNEMLRVYHIALAVCHKWIIVYKISFQSFIWFTYKSAIWIHTINECLGTDVQCLQSASLHIIFKEVSRSHNTSVTSVKDMLKKAQTKSNVWGNSE